MAINMIELSDNFSTWRDAFNQAIDDLNNATNATVADTLVKRDSNGDIKVRNLEETSSVQFKENIRELSDGMEILKQFKPVLYDMKKEYGNDQNMPGFIAEDLLSVYSGLVSKNEESVRYTKVIPLLVSALQSVDERLSTIEKQLQKIQ